jgi:YVTN family beta-propeller protein
MVRLPSYHPLPFVLAGGEDLATGLARSRDAEVGELETRSFPDSEIFVHLRTDPAGHDVATVCTLDRPDPKFFLLDGPQRHWRMPVGTSPRGDQRKGYEMSINRNFVRTIRADLLKAGAAFAGIAGLAILVSASAAAADGEQIAPSGLVYTADEEGNTVSRVELATGEVRTVPVAISPHNVQVSADGKKLFVVGMMTMKNVHGHGHDGEQGTVLVFDTAEFGKASPVEIEVGEHPAHVVVTDDGKQALVTNSEDNDVSLIDVAAATVTGTISTGEFPHGLRIGPDGKEAYVANVKDGSVSVLDMAAAKEVARIAVGKAPVQVGFTPDGREVFVSLRDEDKVAVIDTSTRKVTGRIAVGDGPIQVHATPDGRLVLVANQGTETKPGDTVSLIDVAKRRVVATLATGPGAHGVAVDKDGRLAFVTNIYAGTLSVIDLAALRVVATIPVGKGPNGVTYQK